MNLQSINITNNHQQPNFKGVRLPAGETYKSIYPDTGIRNDIEILVSQGRLTKEQVSSLHQLLGNDDIHLEKSDAKYLVEAKKFSMINKSANFKALEQIIKNALTLSNEVIDTLYSGVLKIKQSTADQIAQIVKPGGNTNFLTHYGERCREAFVDSTINQVRTDLVKESTNVTV